MFEIQSFKELLLDLKNDGLINNLKDFVSKMGMNYTYISEINSGRKPISYELIEKVNDFFRKDYYYKPKNNQNENNLIKFQDAVEMTDRIASLSRFVPVFDSYAYASPQSEWDTPEWLNERHLIATTVPEDGHYYWFPIKGDSMCNPHSNKCIQEGDYILARELYKKHWTNTLHLHKVNVWIIIDQHGIRCKEIIRHNRGTGIITCHSWNPDLIYEDFDLHLDDVIKLYYFKELKREKL